MPSIRIRAVVVVALFASLLGCGKEEPKPGAAASPSAAAPAGESTARPSNAARIKSKIVVDECTFEFEAPDSFTENKDNYGEMLGKTFKFQGFAGTTIGGPNIGAAARSPGDPPPIYKGVANGVNLVVHQNPKADPPNALSCTGEEDVKGRALGCTFLAWSPKDHEGDLIEMCKSVRIKVDESKLK